VVCGKFIFSISICGKFLKNTGFKRLKKYGGGGKKLKPLGICQKEKGFLQAKGVIMFIKSMLQNFLLLVNIKLLYAIKYR